MTFSNSQLTGTILGFSLGVFAAGSLDARAQESAGGACPNNAATFADPLSKPHWNGWGATRRNIAFSRRTWRGSIRGTRLD
jgi:hypothetical protein